MSLKGAWATLPLYAKGLAIPGVVVAVAMDVLGNILASVVFAQLPDYKNGRYLLTQRCDGYLALNPPTWRTKIASGICALLNPFQIGGHCHPG
jgi:hypothetical protein